METVAQTIHLLLVDDHAIFRQGVAGALAGPDLTVEHCATIAEALEIISRHPIDLVLLDHDLGSERASHFLPVARQAGYRGRVLVVTAWITENEARRLLRQGVSGIFLKHAPLEELREAIRITMEGGSYMDPSFARSPEKPPAAEPDRGPLFNDRERRVLRGVLEGLSNKEIAWRLQISESYVKAILQGLFQKTGVRTRGQLVRVVFEQYEQEL